jgi:hypothetical protein
MTIRRMRIACWITKATNTHIQQVIRIAFTTTTFARRRRRVITRTLLLNKIYNVLYLQIY